MGLIFSTGTAQHPTPSGSGRDAEMAGVATVHLVDDDPSFLAATSRFIRTAGFPVVTHASGAELLACVSSETRGCVVADLDMPALNGLELQTLLTGRGIRMPVIFLTGHGNIPSTVQAMRSGAVDFLEKLAPGEHLVTAIARALWRDAEARVAHKKMQERRRRFASLTERERDVLALVVQGKMNKQIAAVLGLHERTVKLHRTAISAKLGIHSVAQLAILTREAHLDGDAAWSLSR
jgi:two-component system, LuxR family, response regulator FixJ